MFFIAMSILNLETHDSDLRNLVPTVRDSDFRRGMRSSIFRDVTPCWLVVTDVSKERIVSIISGPAVQEEFFFYR